MLPSLLEFEPNRAAGVEGEEEKMGHNGAYLTESNVRAATNDSVVVPNWPSLDDGRLWIPGLDLCLTARCVGNAPVTRRITHESSQKCRHSTPTSTSRLKNGSRRGQVLPNFYSEEKAPMRQRLSRRWRSSGWDRWVEPLWKMTFLPFSSLKPLDASREMLTSQHHKDIVVVNSASG